MKRYSFSAPIIIGAAIMIGISLIIIFLYGYTVGFDAGYSGAIIDMIEQLQGGAAKTKTIIQI